MRKLKTIQCRCGLQVNMIKSYTLCPSCNNPLFYTTEDQQQCFAKFYKGQVVDSRYITKGSIVESSLLLGMSAVYGSEKALSVKEISLLVGSIYVCLLYTSPSPRD